MQRLLSDAFVRSVKPPASGRLEISDVRCGGLTLRITVNGIKTWAFRFRDRASGRPGRATIGRYPAIGLTAARSAADAMRQEVAAGGNPARRRRQDRAKADSTTFGALAARYIAEHAQRHKRSHARDARNLELHILPRWRSRPYTGIKRADVIELVERIIAAGKPTLANRMHSLVSSIFTFGMDAELIESNPCHRLKKRGSENVGRRVLSDGELRLFWRGVIEPARSRRTGLALRLALLTGARVGEVAGLCRAELERLGEPTRAAWIIPGTRTKNGRDHMIPLVPLARDIVLELLSLIEPDGQFLLPTRARRRAGHVRGNTLTQTMDYFGRRLKGDALAVRTWKAEPPTPHDLRRTVGTRLAELRIPKEIRDRVLNHAAGDVGSKHYNLHDYADEKRDALLRWAHTVNAIVMGKSANVVPIVRGHRA
jgi:integrase